MPFLFSLLCVKGDDNALRLLTISLIGQLTFLLSVALFPESKIAQSVFAVISAITIAISTKRRSNDIGRYSHWIWIYPVSVLVTSVIYIAYPNTIPLWLTLMPVIISAITFLQPQTNKDYTLGYTGPVDLSDYSTQSKTQYMRVEPSINGSATMDIQTTIQQSRTTANTASSGQPISAFTLNALSSKAKFIALITTLGVVALLLAVLMPSSAENKDITPQESASPRLNKAIKNHKLTLPDNFSLYLNDHNALAISWQTDEILDNGFLWQLATAQGDKSCENITFNNGKNYRTLEVVAEQDGLYASFSPLDTQTIVQQIAFKSSFKLCGYSFSLKGSQVALGKHPAYAAYVEY